MNAGFPQDPLSRIECECPSRSDKQQDIGSGRHRIARPLTVNGEHSGQQWIVGCRDAIHIALCYVHLCRGKHESLVRHVDHDGCSGGAGRITEVNHRFRDSGVRRAIFLLHRQVTQRLERRVATVHQFLGGGRQRFCSCHFGQRLVDRLSDSVEALFQVGLKLPKIRHLPSFSISSQ